MIKAKEREKLPINIILILFNVIVIFVIFVVLPTQQNQLESFDDD